MSFHSLRAASKEEADAFQNELRKTKQNKILERSNFSLFPQEEFLIHEMINNDIFKTHPLRIGTMWPFLSSHLRQHRRLYRNRMSHLSLLGSAQKPHSAIRISHQDLPSGSCRAIGWISRENNEHIETGLYGLLLLVSATHFPRNSVHM